MHEDDPEARSVSQHTCERRSRGRERCADGNRKRQGTNTLEVDVEGCDEEGRQVPEMELKRELNRHDDAGGQDIAMVAKVIIK